MPPKGKINDNNINKNENLPDVPSVNIVSGNDQNKDVDNQLLCRWLNIDESIYNAFISAETEDDKWRYFYKLFFVSSYFSIRVLVSLYSQHQLCLAKTILAQP